MTTSISARIGLDPLGAEAALSDGASVGMVAEQPDGSGVGGRPKEVLLAALAGCTAMDVAIILRKKRQGATSYEVAVTGESAEEPPRVFTSIVVEHRVSGDVEPEALRRSIELSATRYCPVSAMLSAVARVEHRYLLLDAAGTSHEATVAIVGPDREIRVIRDT
jgi:putative redox protein